MNQSSSLRSTSYAVESLDNPRRLHIVRATPAGIEALKTHCRRRFEAGRAVGLAEAQDRIEQLTSAIKALTKAVC